jgi:heat shock protein HslJ
VLLAALVAAGGLAGCAPADQGAEAPVEDLTGVWGIQDTVGVVSLELAGDGSVSGTDGCNRVTGTWEQNGTQVAFGPWATTRMACPSVDTWVTLSVKATLEGDDLVFVDQYAVEVGTLQPNT